MNVIEFIVYMSIANPGIDPEIDPFFSGKFVDRWIDSKSQICEHTLESVH